MNGYMCASHVKARLARDGYRTGADFIAFLNAKITEQIEGALIGIRGSGRKTIIPEHAEKGVPVLRLARDRGVQIHGPDPRRKVSRGLLGRSR